MHEVMTKVEAKRAWEASASLIELSPMYRELVRDRTRITMVPLDERR